MQLTGHTSTHDLSFTPMHGSAMMNGMGPLRTDTSAPGRARGLANAVKAASLGAASNAGNPVTSHPSARPDRSSGACAAPPADPPLARNHVRASAYGDTQRIPYGESRPRP